MLVQLPRRTILRIRSLVGIAGLFIIVGFLWELIADRAITLAGVGIGLTIGLALAVMEESRLASFTRSMPFTRAILVKSAVYLVAMSVPLLISGFIGGYFSGLTLSDYFIWIASFDFLLKLLAIFVSYLVFIFFRHLNRLLGPKTLMRYLTGRYHHPSIETRIFMFLDIKSSTQIAERLDKESYFSLLNTFFRDISEPILERRAEIYQYIGDEIVLTWPLEDGLKDANCIRVFIEIAAAIHAKRHHYMEQFGVVPTFKAGLHYGDVVTAEIGDLKKEIVYNGDVLNTTARIEGVCNRFDRQLIASEALVSVIQLPEFTTPEPLGPVDLRGKAEPVELVALA